MDHFISLYCIKVSNFETASRVLKILVYHAISTYTNIVIVRNVRKSNLNSFNKLQFLGKIKLVGKIIISGGIRAVTAQG